MCRQFVLYTASEKCAHKFPARTYMCVLCWCHYSENYVASIILGPIQKQRLLFLLFGKSARELWRVETERHSAADNARAQEQFGGCGGL